jgi:hypothetical protein
MVFQIKVLQLFMCRASYKPHAAKHLTRDANKSVHLVYLAPVKIYYVMKYIFNSVYNEV